MSAGRSSSRPSRVSACSPGGQRSRQRAGEVAEGATHRSVSCRKWKQTMHEPAKSRKEIVPAKTFKLSRYINHFSASVIKHHCQTILSSFNDYIRRSIASCLESGSRNPRPKSGLLRKPSCTSAPTRRVGHCSLSKDFSVAMLLGLAEISAYWSARSSFCWRTFQSPFSKSVASISCNFSIFKKWYHF